MTLLDFFRTERRANAPARVRKQPRPIGWQQGSTLLKMAYERERREHHEKFTTSRKCA